MRETKKRDQRETRAVVDADIDTVQKAFGELNLHPYSTDDLAKRLWIVDDWFMPRPRCHIKEDLEGSESSI